MKATDPELAIKEWESLRKRLKTLGGSTMAVSLLNLRQDAGFLATTAGATPYALTHPDVFADLPLTFDSLHKTVDALITEPFLRNFIDTMCIFCGFPAKGAMTAHMLYILERFFEEGTAYSVPIGGTCEMGNTLVRGLEKFGGKIQLNAHVDEIMVENGKAVGVRLKNGSVIKSKMVVSNATPFDTVKMLGTKQELPDSVRVWREALGKLPRHGAILHLFLAIDATGLDLSHIEDPAHLVVQDWGRSLQDSQNLCSFFIPSLLDPSVCPPGKHVIHVYSSGGEPYEAWEKLTPGTAEYEALKEKRSQVLWQAVERCIPDVRKRVEFSIVGSPLAHEAFLRRDRGTYGCPSHLAFHVDALVNHCLCCEGLVHTCTFEPLATTTPKTPPDRLLLIYPERYVVPWSVLRQAWRGPRARALPSRGSSRTSSRSRSPT